MRCAHVRYHLAGNAVVCQHFWHASGKSSGCPRPARACGPGHHAAYRTRRGGMMRAPSLGHGLVTGARTAPLTGQCPPLPPKNGVRRNPGETGPRATTPSIVAIERTRFRRVTRRRVLMGLPAFRCPPGPSEPEFPGRARATRGRIDLTRAPDGFRLRLTCGGSNVIGDLPDSPTSDTGAALFRRPPGSADFPVAPNGHASVAPCHQRGGTRHLAHRSPR